MTFGKVALFFALIAFSVAGGFFLGQQTNTPVIAQKKSLSQNFDLLRRMKAEKIKEFKTFDDGENEFYAVIREINEPQTKSSGLETANKIDIYDDSGKAVYEYKDLGISGLESNRFLKSDSWEIMFSTNGGGTDDFLKILSYKNGKFTEILKDESDMQYRGGYFTMLQYRNGMSVPYGKPSQLIVIQQLGGSDGNPSASVFRTKDNKFQKVGEIKMQELGDFIENQIARKK